MALRIKRIYEPADHGDGVRVLVDRLWPRGISKDRIDLWLKDIAPSTALRKWFGHVPARWAGFRARYARELKGNAVAVAELRKLMRGKTVTLLYGARDTEHNEAVALANFLKARKMPDKRKPSTRRKKKA
jgi:uncharacterized protein YeaO (DUF488 family)